MACIPALACRRPQKNYCNIACNNRSHIFDAVATDTRVSWTPLLSPLCLPVVKVICRLNCPKWPSPWALLRSPWRISVRIRGLPLVTGRLLLWALWPIDHLQRNDIVVHKQRAPPLSMAVSQNIFYINRQQQCPSPCSTQFTIRSRLRNATPRQRLVIRFRYPTVPLLRDDKRCRSG